MRLTKTQEGILNAEMVVGSPISNICGATIFPHSFSNEELNAAANTVIRINDAFRLRVDFSSKTQWTEAYQWQDYEVIDFNDWEAFEIYAEHYAKTPLNLSGVLFDVKIFTVGEISGLLYVIHHAICDAWCLSVIRWQLHEILEKRSIPAGYSFLSHCEKEKAYLNSKRFQRDRSFFITQYEKNKEALLLPEHHIMSHETHYVTKEIPADISKMIAAYNEETEVSSFVILLSAFAVCYSKTHSNANQFYLGTTVLNRASEEELKTIGPFINDIALFVSLESDSSAAKMIHRIEESVMDAFRHQKYNYPMLQEELHGKTGIQLYDVRFNYQSEFDKVEDYIVKWFQNGVQMEPLQIHIDHRNDMSRLEVTYSYIAELYGEEEIKRLHQYFMHVLEEMISQDTKLISEISLLRKEQLETVLTFSRGAEVMPPNKSVYQLFEERNEGIITEGENEYSFDDLKRDAELIDAAIHGFKRIIGVICDRSYLELAAIYGIIRGGNAYLPISPEYPEERIRILLETSGCDTILAQKKYQHLVPESLVIEDLLDTPSSTIPSVNAMPDDLLYVIYTSGSTGIPKGAAISNRSAVNRILWMCRKYFNQQSVVMLKTPFTFDVSVWEIFGFALGGFSLYILPPEDHYRQDRVLAHIRKGKVTDLHFVPTVFGYFLEELKKEGGLLPSLKNIFLSGEALTASLANNAPIPVRNLYGPTECAVDVTYYDCKIKENDPVPIGRPIDNCQIYVLDNQLGLLPVGVTGQICIGGIPVGQGYVKDASRTAEVFITNPYGEGRLYLTGDLGYWREDGQLIYVGRRDRQIKLNGQRIELGEIEAALSSMVPSCAVVVENDRMTAFYSGEEQSALREKMSRILPNYMVPHSFVHVETMPLTMSGKIDRKALLSVHHRQREFVVAPVTPEEQILVDAVREVLSLTSVSIDDNFYEIGGDSLLSIHVATLLQERGFSLQITEFLKSETLRAAAGKMRVSDMVVSSNFQGPVPITPIMKAFLHENPENIGAFTQSCIIPIDAAETDIKKALDIVTAHHDMLRAVFSRDGYVSIGDRTYTFRIENGPVIDEQISFDIYHGPLVDAVLYPGLLRLTIHHFVIDAVSWEFVISDLYTALRHEPLPEKTASYIEWAQLNSVGGKIQRKERLLPVLKPDNPVNAEERYSFSVRGFSNEIILTAVGLAANEYVGGRAGICIETHGRTDYRFSRTVGWFTTIYPFSTDSLTETRETIRQLRDDGADNSFIYDALPEDSSILYNFIPLTRRDLDISIPIFPGKININCLQKGDTADIEVGVLTGRHPQGITKHLGTAIQNCLKALKSEGAVTEQEESDVEASYDLTPAQTGMFNNWDSYLLQYTIAFEEVDFDRLVTAFVLLAQRHPILKSTFTRLKDGTIKGRILKNCMPFLQYGNTHRGNPKSLLRVAVENNRLIINTHHIILDGWSLAILARDLKRFYNTPEIRPMPTLFFGVYTAWLMNQRLEYFYWQELLHDCGISSDLPHNGNATGCRHQDLEHSCSDTGVAEYAREKHVSVNSVLEAAFSMLLLQNNTKAIFGKMLSGRNAPIQGIDDMVGPFVNMIPVFIRNEHSLLRQIHEQSVMANQYGNVSLTELYTHTDLKRINILFVFENYPGTESIDVIDYHEENEFDLTFAIRKRDHNYIIRASYSPEKYDSIVIEKALMDYEQVLRKIVTDDTEVVVSEINSNMYIPPQNETEAIICRLFEKVTGTERVSRMDNYFDLGGTSLGMMELLSSESLKVLSSSEFMMHPTPAELALLIEKHETFSTIVPLYIPKAYGASIILFPYGGGDAASYTSLVSEFRRRNAPAALYFCPWTCNYDTAVQELRAIAKGSTMSFYSHCAGAVIALKLLDQLNAEKIIVKNYIAGANIPPKNTRNIWLKVPDSALLFILHKAGMPELPEEQTKDMLNGFRNDTEAYFQYFQEKTEKTPVSVNVIISRKDIFTRNYRHAQELWEMYVESVGKIRYIDYPTHYFQSSHASVLADILLEEV